MSRRLLVGATRRAAAPALALLGGVLVALALPPFGWWPLAPIGCAALLGSLRGVGSGSRALRGWCFGLGQFAVSLHFVLEFSAVGYALLIVAEALFPALAALTAGRRGSGYAFAAALSLVEWGREHVPFGGLPPGGIPLVGPTSPFGVLARLGGPALVTMGVAATAATLVAVVALAMRAWHGAAASRVPWIEGAVLLGATVLVGVGGALAPAGGAAARSITAVGVQGGGPRGLHQTVIPGMTAFVRGVEASSQIAGPVGLVLWPEDTVPLPNANPPDTALGGRLAVLARHLHADLLAGVTEPIGATRFLNEEVAFDPQGGYVGAIEKVHAVPFGEYVPLRPLLSHLVSLAAVPRDAVVGHNDGVLDLGGTRVGVLISFETFFPDRGAVESRAGAEVLLVPTNTASYASTELPTQELAATRLLAIATGRDVLQAATTGYSALVTPQGEVEHMTRLDAVALVRATLPLRSGLTLYDRFGELPVLVIATAAVLGAWARLRERATRR